MTTIDIDFIFVKYNIDSSYINPIHELLPHKRSWPIGSKAERHVFRPTLE